VVRHLKNHFSIILPSWIQHYTRFRKPVDQCQACLSLDFLSKLVTKVPDVGIGLVLCWRVARSSLMKRVLVAVRSI
jgi:hypothetical protein